MSDLQFGLIRALVLQVLREHARHDWQLQGFGMLRTYLPNDVRLHVWDERYAVANVTTIHDHPWHFSSLIVAGILKNRTFNAVEHGTEFAATHMLRTIKPGVGLQVVAEDQPVRLVERTTDHYTAGEVYHQRGSEVHESMPECGTVTLVQRYREGADIAKSFYPMGSQWVSAEPRAATPLEVADIVGHSLEKWFGVGVA